MTTEGRFKGKYAGGIQFGIASTGTDQIALDLALDNGETVTTVLPFTDASAQYSIQRIRALGWKGRDLGAISESELTEDVDVEVKSESYQGKSRIRVEIMTGGRFVFEKPMNLAQRKSFAARFSAFAAGSPPPARSAAPPPARNAQRPPPVDPQAGEGWGDSRDQNPNDEIPF